MTEDEWTKIEHFVDVLRLPYLMTKRIQEKLITLSDFYAEWLIVQIGLNKMKDGGSSFAPILLTCLQKRKSALLDKSMMLAALFLDPRFKNILSSQQKAAAKVQILRVNERLQAMKRKQNEQNEQNDGPQTTDSSMQDLERFLSSMEAVRTGDATSESESPESNFLKFNKQLDAFEATPREPVKLNVIEYWQQNRVKFPDLFETAMQIFAFSPTQVSVEQLFSCLSFILSPSRTCLSDKHLNDIILIRQNGEMHDIINERDLMKIRFGEDERFVFHLCGMYIHRMTSF